LYFSIKDNVLSIRTSEMTLWWGVYCSENGILYPYTWVDVTDYNSCIVTNTGNVTTADGVIRTSFGNINFNTEISLTSQTGVIAFYAAINSTINREKTAQYKLTLYK